MSVIAARCYFTDEIGIEEHLEAVEVVKVIGPPVAAAAVVVAEHEEAAILIVAYLSAPDKVSEVDVAAEVVVVVVAAAAVAGVVAEAAEAAEAAVVEELDGVEDLGLGNPPVVGVDAGLAEAVEEVVGDLGRIAEGGGAVEVVEVACFPTPFPEANEVAGSLEEVEVDGCCRPVGT